MYLSGKERDKLALRNAGVLAQNRLANGLKLNYPEVVALLASQVCELAREGKHSVAQIMDVGRTMIGRRQVMPGVKPMLSMVQVEATFRDGTKLVTIDDPICKEDGDLSLALKGSFFPVPDVSVFAEETKDDAAESIPGEIIPDSSAEDIVINKGRKRLKLSVTNTGDRPVQVGSHYHFTETNRCLDFDREATVGMRLNIPAGTAVRFEPGETKSVVLVKIAGNQIVRGGNNLVNGSATLSEEVSARIAAFENAKDAAPPDAKRRKVEGKMTCRCSRRFFEICSYWLLCYSERLT